MIDSETTMTLRCPKCTAALSVAALGGSCCQNCGTSFDREALLDEQAVRLRGPRWYAQHNVGELVAGALGVVLIVVGAVLTFTLNMEDRQVIWTGGISAVGVATVCWPAYQYQTGQAVWHTFFICGLGWLLLGLMHGYVL